MSRVHSTSAAGPFPATRRQAVALLGGGLAASFAQGAGRAMAAATTTPPDMLFDVYRNGDRIGSHEMRFKADAGGLAVSSRVELAVKMAFITVYRYQQTGQDEWRDGVLVGTRIETDDNGKKSLVVAKSEQGKLAVQGPTGAYETDFGPMTDLSFWNDGITKAPPVIDSQTAELITMAVQPGSSETIQVLGQPVDTRRYTMAATKGRSGTVWYDATGKLVKAIVITRGETLGYELTA